MESLRLILKHYTIPFFDDVSDDATLQTMDEGALQAHILHRINHLSSVVVFFDDERRETCEGCRELREELSKAETEIKTLRRSVILNDLKHDSTSNKWELFKARDRIAVLKRQREFYRADNDELRKDLDIRDELVNDAEKGTRSAREETRIVRAAWRRTLKRAKDAEEELRTLKLREGNLKEMDEAVADTDAVLR